MVLSPIYYGLSALGLESFCVGNAALRVVGAAGGGFSVGVEPRLFLQVIALGQDSSRSRRVLSS